jgi:hypothetical protein
LISIAHPDLREMHVMAQPDLEPVQNPPEILLLILLVLLLPLKSSYPN